MHLQRLAAHAASSLGKLGDGEQSLEKKPALRRFLRSFWHCGGLPIDRLPLAVALEERALAEAKQFAILIPMSSDVQEIEQAIRTLPRRDVEQLREWIEDFLEDQLQLTDEFQARIERGKQEIREGAVRVQRRASL